MKLKRNKLELIAAVQWWFLRFWCETDVCCSDILDSRIVSKLKILAWKLNGMCWWLTCTALHMTSAASFQYVLTTGITLFQSTIFLWWLDLQFCRRFQVTVASRQRTKISESLSVLNSLEWHDSGGKHHTCALHDLSQEDSMKRNEAENTLWKCLHRTDWLIHRYCRTTVTVVNNPDQSHLPTYWWLVSRM